MEHVSQKRNPLAILFSVVLSYFLLFGIFRFFSISFPYSEIIFLVAMFGLNTLILRSMKLLLQKKLTLCATAFCIPLATTFVIGTKISMWEKPYFEYFQAQDLLFLLQLALVLFFAIINLLQVVIAYSVPINKPKASYRFWLLIFIGFVALWLPYLLTYYPGTLSRDSFVTIYQSIGVEPYHNHHPIMFTLFANIFIEIGLLFGDLNFGVACFSFAQLLVVAAVLSYMVYWLKKKGVPNYIWITTALFFGINPIIAMYTITMWKDVMFGCWVLLLVLLLYETVESNGQSLCSVKGIAKLAAASLLVSFGRNNGIYVIIAIMIVLALSFRTYLKRLVPSFVAIVLVITVVQGPIYNAVGIKAGGFAESVGIPLQQIGYTLAEGGEVTESQKEFLNKLLPVETIIDNYRPNSPDYIKFDENFDDEFLHENKGEFLKIWFEMLPSNFTKYVKAWLMQTLGYYHIGTTNWVVMYGFDTVNLELESYGLVNTNWMEKWTGINLQPMLEGKVKQLTANPLIGNLFSIAFMVWLTLFACVSLFLKKRFKYIISLIPLIAIWGTMLIAVPTFCEFRYMFSFHLALPFILFLLVTKKQETKTDEPIKD